MYTITINDDKTLTTSVKSTLLRHTTTDEIWLLWKPTSPIEPNSDDGDTGTKVEVENVYTALLRYESNKIMKTETLTVDGEPYKERIRFRVPLGSAFFSNRGMLQVWVELTTYTTITTTTTVIDPETGEETTETTVQETTNTFSTLPTKLFIEEVPLERNYPWYKDDNTIRITRGDTLNITVTLTDNDGYIYTPSENDTVLFTVKKSAVASDILIQKTIDITTLELELVESDTRDLAFGEYKYEVEVVTEHGDHYTVIKNAPFIVTEELH